MAKKRRKKKKNRQTTGQPQQSQVRTEQKTEQKSEPADRWRFEPCQLSVPKTIVQTRPTYEGCHLPKSGLDLNAVQHFAFSEKEERAITNFFLLDEGDQNVAINEVKIILYLLKEIDTLYHIHQHLVDKYTAFKSVITDTLPTSLEYRACQVSISLNIVVPNNHSGLVLFSCGKPPHPHSRDGYKNIQISPEIVSYYGLEQRDNNELVLKLIHYLTNRWVSIYHKNQHLIDECARLEPACEIITNLKMQNVLSGEKKGNQQQRADQLALKEAQQRIEQLQQQLEQSQAEREKSVAREKKSQAELAEQKRERQSERDCMQAEITRLNQQLTNFDIITHKEVDTRLTSCTESLQSNISDLEKEIVELKMLLGTTQQELRKTKEKNIDLCYQFNQLNASYAGLKNKLANLKQTIHNLQFAISRRNTDITQLQVELQSTQNEYWKMCALCMRLQEDIKQLKHEREQQLIEEKRRYASDINQGRPLGKEWLRQRTVQSANELKHSSQSFSPNNFSADSTTSSLGSNQKGRLAFFEGLSPSNTGGREEADNTNKVQMPSFDLNGHET